MKGLFFLFLLFALEAAFPQNQGAKKAGYFDGEKIRSVEFSSGGRADFYSARNNTFYRIEFNGESGDFLSGAKEKYFSDFERQKLKKKASSESAKKYGGTKITLYWNNTPDFSDGGRRADTVMSAGYVFKGGSPYFCILIDGAKNEGENKSRVLENSGSILLLFNKKQIDKFVLLCYTE